MSELLSAGHSTGAVCCGCCHLSPVGSSAEELSNNCQVFVCHTHTHTCTKRQQKPPLIFFLFTVDIRFFSSLYLLLLGREISFSIADVTVFFSQPRLRHRADAPTPLPSSQLVVALSCTGNEGSCPRAAVLCPGPERAGTHETAQYQCYLRSSFFLCRGPELSHSRWFSRLAQAEGSNTFVVSSNSRTRSCIRE